MEREGQITIAEETFFGLVHVGGQSAKQY